jgi:hypothetical protein
MKWIVVQGLSRKSVPDLKVYAQQVVKMMSESVWFPQPFPAGIPSLAQLQQHIDELSEAMSAPDTGKSKTNAVRLARYKIENDLFLLGRGYVASLAAGNNEKGGTIILSAGMSYRIHGKRKAYTFTVKNDKQQGCVRATAVRNHRDSVYVWQYKRSNERSFTEAAKTFTAKYIYQDLVQGERYHFRVRTVTPRRGIDLMSEVMELVVV